jgi:hypothetical protein
MSTERRIKPKWGLLLLVLIFAAYIANNITASTPTLTIHLGPEGNSVEVSQGFAVSVTGEAVVEGLPKGYKVPKDIIVYKIDNPAELYRVELGQTGLRSPHDNTITIPLCDELKIPLQQDFTHIQFEEGWKRCK